MVRIGIESFILFHFDLGHNFVWYQFENTGPVDNTFDCFDFSMIIYRKHWEVLKTERCKLILQNL